MIQDRWNNLISELNTRFGTEMDLDGVIFLIGVQELGRGAQKFSKDQKMDVMHVATCRLLTPYGYYEYEGMDDEGWPHYSPKMQLPRLSPGQQKQFMMEAILRYFEEAEKKA